MVPNAGEPPRSSSRASMGTFALYGLMSGLQDSRLSRPDHGGGECIRLGNKRCRPRILQGGPARAPSPDRPTGTTDRTHASSDARPAHAWAQDELLVPTKRQSRSTRPSALPSGSPCKASELPVMRTAMCTVMQQCTVQAADLPSTAFDRCDIIESGPANATAIQASQILESEFPIKQLYAHAAFRLRALRSACATPAPMAPRILVPVACWSAAGLCIRWHGPMRSLFNWASLSRWPCPSCQSLVTPLVSQDMRCYCGLFGPAISRVLRWRHGVE